MSDEEPTTKAGHAPAEKIAGGVRIARKERVQPSGGDSSNNAATEKPGSDAEESYEVEKKSHNEVHDKAFQKQIKKDFPTEGIKVAHEKPHASKEHPHHNTPKQNHAQLFQPRKE